jgi:WD40 repeat protein
MKKSILLFLIVISLNCFAQLSELKAPSANTNCSAFDISPNGKYVITADGYTVRLLDVKTGKELREFNFKSYSVCFSPDGKSFAVSEENEIKIVDIITGNVLKSKSDIKGRSYLCFSPDGKNLTFFSGSFLQLWDMATEKLRNIETGKQFHGYGREGGYFFDKLKFSKNGKLIISSDWGTEDGDKAILNINIWDVNSGVKIRSFAADNYNIADFDISDDETQIASVHGNDTIKIWDLNSGRLRKIITPNKNANTSRDEDAFQSVCFTPDVKNIVTGNETNYRKASIKLWNAESGTIISEFGNGNNINSIKFINNSSDFVAASMSIGVKVYDFSTNKIVQNFARNAFLIEEWTNTQAGDQFLINMNSETNFKLLDNTFKSIMIFDNSRRKTYGLMHFSSNTDTIITCTYSDVYFWNSTTGKSIKEYKNILNGNSLLQKVISNDSRYLMEYSERGDWSYNYFDLNSGTVLGKKVSRTGWDPDIHAMCFSPDNKYFAAGMRTEYDLNTGRKLGDEEKMRLVGIWETSTGKQIVTFPTQHQSGFIQDICFSVDGRYLFTNTNTDEIIYQWDLTGNLIKSFKGRISSLSKNGQYLLAWLPGKKILYDIETGNTKQIFEGKGSDAYLSEDCNLLHLNFGKCLQTYSVSTGKLLYSHYFIGNSDWVTITPDGFFDGTPNGLKELYYVNGLEIIPLESTFEQFYTPNLAQRLIAGEKLQNSIVLSQLKPAPVIKIASPENNSVQTNNNLSISVEVKDNGGGIDEIQLFHNGKLVETTQRGFKSISTKNIQNYSITLVDGVNTFKATAFNLQRTEAIPDIIQINYSGQKATSNLYLFVIGINNYKNPKNKLNYAVTDAATLKETIESGSKEIFGSINTIYLQDSKATKPEIINAFNSIKESVKPEDVFIFYYAGHGVMSEEAKSKFYLVPFDVIQLFGDNESLKTLAISSEELQELSKEIKAQKQLYILDACQSGGMVELLASRGSAEQKAIAQLARSTGTYWLTASNSEQFASEFATLGHGLFTYTLLQGLNGQADGGAKDKKITVEELNSYIKNILPELSTKYKGEAQYPNSYGYGNDFPIVIVKQ